MADIGALVIRIGADASELSSAFSKMATEGKNFGRQLENAGKIAAGMFLSAAAAATAMTIVAGKQAEELAQLSQITGINTAALQAYDVMLNRVGLGATDMATAMRVLSTNMEQARLGTGTAADRFRQLGIEITKVTSTDDLIRKIAESVSQFANGTEKAAIMADLFGKAGLKFIPLFEGGAKAINEAAEASKRLGAELSGIQLEVLTRMDDAVDDLNTSWKRFGQQLGVVVAPSVQLVTQALSALLSIGSHVFRELDIAADTLAIRFSHVALAVNEIASTLFSSNVLSGDAWKQTAENLKMIDAEAAKLIAKRREIATMGGPEDARAKPPLMLDSKKLAVEAKKAADIRNKAFADGLEMDEKRRIFLEAHPEGMESAGGPIQAGLGRGITQGLIDARNFENKMINESLADNVRKADTVLALQQEIFQSSVATIDGTEVVRAAAFAKIQADFDQKKALIDQEVSDRSRAIEMITDLELRAEAQRMAAIRQFPTFWEQQLQAVVQSNAFSVSSIVSSWTSGLAQAIVEWENFSSVIQSVWKATQVALVQGILNTFVQWGAQAALAAAKDEGIQAALLATKTFLFGAEATAKTTAVVAGAKAEQTAAAASLVSLAAVGAAALKMAGAIVAATVAIYEGLAAAATASVVGAPLAPGFAAAGVAIGTAGAAAILAAGAVITGATVAAAGAAALAEGGIVTGPTLAMIGEAGPEAVLPLSSMSDFGGRPTIIHTHVTLDGREIATATARHLPRAFRLAGAPA